MSESPQIERLAFVILSTEQGAAQRLEDEMAGRGWKIHGRGRYSDAKGRTVIACTGFTFMSTIPGTKPERIYIAPLTRHERTAFVEAVETFAASNDVEVVDIVKSRAHGIFN